MSDDGNYDTWLKLVGLSLIGEDDLTSRDYPDYGPATDEDMAGELKGLPIPDDADPTLQLECSKCGASFAACVCRGGPRKLWQPGPLPFEELHRGDAD